MPEAGNDQMRKLGTVMHGVRGWSGLARLGAACLACCVLAAGCGSGPPARSRASAPAAGRSREPAGAGRAGHASPGGLGKILVIMEENHSVQQVFPHGMPYLWGLARRYAYATAWSDIGHPSLPNYLAVFAGSAFGDPKDCAPAPGCTYPGPTVFGQALARGETARAYEESMPQPCDAGYSGEYDVNHNPWAYFPGEAAQCRADEVRTGTPASGPLASDVRHGALPAVGLITPDLMHDAHDGTLAQADAWLKGWIPVLMSGPDWRAGRLAIAVVFDEGVTTEQVPFVLITPGATGVTVRMPLNQYALTRLIDEVIGAPPLRNAAAAATVAPLFGLRS
jgi:hypothetical protein